MVGCCGRSSDSRPWRFAFPWRCRNLCLFSTAAVVVFSIFVLTRLESDFLPPFNEGSVQVNVLAAARGIATKF